MIERLFGIFQGCEPELWIIAYAEHGSPSIYHRFSILGLCWSFAFPASGYDLKRQ